MPKRTGILKHLSEIITKNKTLTAENEQLNNQNEVLLKEIEKYKILLARMNNETLYDEVQYKKRAPFKRFRTATVLYADAVGLEQYSQQVEPKLLLDSLDEIFFKLQDIIAKFEVRNIKTIGDTFMCVGGIPKKNFTNPIEVLLAAIEMQYFINELQKKQAAGKIWKLRIGIHTGNVITNIIGKKKPVYEVKGETVNLAARIRQFCKDGHILISATTYELVKDLFVIEYYNKMPVKYQGEILLYSVDRIKPEFSLQGKGIIPNKKFSIRYGLMQFTDLQELILDKMERELPQSLYYHNTKHTVDVVTQVELIGLGEGVSEEDLLLLKTAALFHDTGHIVSYDNHEHFSCILAREMLPEYYYTRSQIEIICELIMSTKLPPKPGNKLQEIMCDADLDYLGRSDMIAVSDTLFHELRERSKINSINDWNNLQMKFISGHQYFTDTARKLREVNKQLQIDRIRNLIVEE